VLQTSDTLDGTSRLRIGMGTLIAISAAADSAQRELAGIDAAFAAFEQVAKLMHPTRSGSDLAAVHQTKLGTPLAVHAWTWEVLALSLRLNRLSKEMFDPCLPDSAGRFSDLELRAPHSVIAHRPLSIDLGGIAKGYAIDRALIALRAAGCRSALVNAGGDMAVFGNRSRPVIIKRQDLSYRVIELKNAALATSDVCNASRPAEHRGYYHGATRRPLKLGSVSIRAASAAVADGLTKCLLAGRGDLLADGGDLPADGGVLPADYDEIAEDLLETFGAQLIV
jgi:FAD:protein FMN transferase